MTGTTRAGTHDHDDHEHARPRDGVTTGTVAGHGGHGGHGDHIKQFRERFWWNLLLAIPVVAFSAMFADLIGYTRPAGTDWISPVLGTVIFFYGGWPFLSGGVSEIRARQPGMMLLIALAITVAFTASLATSLGVGNLDLDFWWELALLVVIMLLGHWLEMKAIGQAQGALAALAELLPDAAERVDRPTATSRRCRSPSCGAGDVVLVRSGARVPADGVDRRRRGRDRRVDGHRRVAAGRRSTSGTASSPAPSRRIPRSACGWKPSATTPRSPASSGSSPRRRRRARVRRRSPTAPPRCSSTWPPAPASSRSSCGCSSATPTMPWSTPSPCS